MDDLVVEHVLVAVEQVPRGAIVSYGDIGNLLGVSPRLVGRVMSIWGSNVTWWRVTSHAGDLPAQLRDEAFQRWAAEGILPKPNGLGCRIANYRADAAMWAAAYGRASAHLPALAPHDGGCSLREGKLPRMP